MSHKLRLTLLVCLALYLGSATKAKADTVTFTNLMFLQMTYTEAGMTVSSPNGLFPASTGVGGSRNLAVLLQNSVTFSMGGAQFNVQSIEINQFLDNGPALPPNTAVFTAFVGPNMVGMLTLVRNPGDPPPPLVLTFGSGFQGITSLVLTSPVIAGQIHVDNLTFQPAQAVPEPATVLLLASGLGGVATRLIRVCKRNN